MFCCLEPSLHSGIYIATEFWSAGSHDQAMWTGAVSGDGEAFGLVLTSFGV